MGPKRLGGAKSGGKGKKKEKVVFYKKTRC
jgi:hypothetical protein